VATPSPVVRNHPSSVSRLERESQKPILRCLFQGCPPATTIRETSEPLGLVTHRVVNWELGSRPSRFPCLLAGQTHVRWGNSAWGGSQS